MLHIFLALSDRPRHGHAIVQEIEERTGGRVVLGTGTLYTALKRLRSEGLIEERTDPETGQDGGSRGRKRRTYGLTKRGRGELSEQTERLQALLDHARQKSALPGDPRRAKG